MAFYRKQPQKLGKLVQDYMEHSPYRKQFLRGRILSLWPEIVGDAISGQCRNLHFEKSRLVVHVHHPGWRQELHMQRFSIMKKLNNAVNEDIISEIIVRA